MRFKKIWIILISIGSLYMYLSGIDNQKVYYFSSEDGQYSIYTSPYRYGLSIPTPMLKVGDLEGKVFLYDEVEKKILESMEIDMLNLVLDIRWQEKKVVLHLCFDWELPRKIEIQ